MLASSASGLGRWGAVPLAISSVAGSGILFLPSVVLSEAGGESPLVWLIAASMCLPMLMMFDDMVRARPESDGIEAFVGAGLGTTIGRCVPTMFVALVAVGLPAGAMVAGRYVASALHAGPLAATGFATALIVVAVGINLVGTTASVSVQRLGAAALVAMALLLIGLTAPAFPSHLDRVAPQASELGRLLPVASLAFWAFAGFENLTFLSGDFRDPERDFLPVCAIALGIYGLLTALLTVAVAVRIPRSRVNEVTGLLQLAAVVPPQALITSAVAAIAFGTVVLNTIVWLWGTSRLISHSASRGLYPVSFSRRSRRGYSPNALLLLGGLAMVGVTIFTLVPGIVVDAVGAAGAVFGALYLLCITSYVRLKGLIWRSALNLLLVPVLALSLAQSGWRSLYAPVAFALALAAALLRKKASNVHLDRS